MAKALEDILGHIPLTTTLRTVASGVPNPFPDELFTVPAKNRLLGDRAQYVRISGERRTSKRVNYGAPAKRRSLRAIQDDAVRMLHTHESFPVDLVQLQKLRAFEQYTQDEGMDWVRYQVEEAAKRQQNNRIIATASMLRYGAIYWDSDGNLLKNSSGADSNLTVSAPIPATHQNQCNSIIDAPWSLPNTDIGLHINNLQQFSIQETGMRLTTALYGINVSKYVRTNNFAQSFLARNPGMNEKISLTNEIPDGLFGIQKWIPVWETFFETDDSGTIGEIWDDDLVVLLPEVKQPDKMGWWGAYEGSYPVPRTIDVQRDPMSAIRNAELVYGMGSYGQATLSPPGVEVYYFDTFLPVYRNEKAPFLVDTVF